MQAPSTQRSIQRRSPVADPGPPPTVPTRSMSPGGGPQPRTSSASAKSVQNGSTSRRQNVSLKSPESGALSDALLGCTHDTDDFRSIAQPTFSKQSKCSPFIANRKERHTSPSSYETAPRNPHTMVPPPGHRCASLRCICTVGI